jgi:hypothetical protein
MRMVFSLFQRLIGVQDEDSCGKSSLCETPQACRGGSRATRGKRSLARKSLAEIKAYTEIVRLLVRDNKFVPASFVVISSLVIKIIFLGKGIQKRSEKRRIWDECMGVGHKAVIVLHDSIITYQMDEQETTQSHDFL